MNIHVYKKSPLVILAVTIFIVILFLFVKDSIVINTSSSIPMGIYSIKPIIAPLKQHDLVALCLNNSDQDFGLSRGYIHTGSRCNGSTPLLKSIIAIPGDNVTLTNKDIIVNGRVYSLPTQKYDSQHRTLPSWPRGSYKNTQRFWVIGTNSKNSWDSRFFGPIPLAQIKYLIIPLLT